MSKLITAGFKRLFRLKSLYACLAVIAFQLIINIGGESGLFEGHIGVRVTSGNMPESVSDTMRDLMLFTADSHISEVSFLLIIAAAIVIGNLIGSEHSFGTIRNKLTVGHNRTEIYFANFIVSLTTVLIMLVFGWALIFGLALPLGAQLVSTAEKLVTLFLLNVLYSIVITAIFVFMAMNILSKSTTLTLSILIGGAALLLNVLFSSQLSQPEYVTPRSQAFDSEGRIISQETLDPQKNPMYIGGTRRVIYETIDTLLPCSAVTEYSGEVDVPKVITEVGELAVFTAAGLFIFRRRDLK
ncbi:MAG: ABC transporter permease subunit [Ruminiclostridium sp.]|nr:ABC transporter permease subunit [Ruminiclostridium sp.]